MKCKKAIVIGMIAIMALSVCTAVSVTTSTRAQALTPTKMGLAVGLPEPGEKTPIWGSVLNAQKGPAPTGIVKIHVYEGSNPVTRLTAVLKPGAGGRSTFSASYTPKNLGQIKIHVMFPEFSSAVFGSCDGWLTTDVKWHTKMTVRLDKSFGTYVDTTPFVRPNQVYRLACVLMDLHGHPISKAKVAMDYVHYTTDAQGKIHHVDKWTQKWATGITSSTGAYYSPNRADPAGSYKGIEHMAYFSGDATHWTTNAVLYVPIRT